MDQRRAVALKSRIIDGDDYLHFLQSSLKGSTRNANFTVVPVFAPVGLERDLGVGVTVALIEVIIGLDRFDFKGVCQGREVSGYYDPRSVTRGGRLNFS